MQQCLSTIAAKRFRIWPVAEIGAVRYPGSTEQSLKSCDSQPSSPPLAIPGVVVRALFIFLSKPI